MKLIQTAILEVVIIEPKIFADERGWFMESFNEQKFHQELINLGLSIPKAFVQDNHSCSNKGVLRGLHYQIAPHTQGKLVRVTQGSVFDVVVDIRSDSPSFGKWVGVELSDKNHRQLWIPEGFAHGFVALEDNTHFLYKTTNYYSQECERSILWNDENLGIKWPNKLGELILSIKDNEAKPFQKEFKSRILEKNE